MKVIMVAKKEKKKIINLLIMSVCLITYALVLDVLGFNMFTKFIYAIAGFFLGWLMSTVVPIVKKYMTVLKDYTPPTAADVQEIIAQLDKEPVVEPVVKSPTSEKPEESAKPLLSTPTAATSVVTTEPTIDVSEEKANVSDKVELVTKENEQPIHGPTLSILQKPVHRRKAKFRPILGPDSVLSDPEPVAEIKPVPKPVPKPVSKPVPEGKPIAVPTMFKTVEPVLSKDESAKLDALVSGTTVQTPTTIVEEEVTDEVDDFEVVASDDEDDGEEIDYMPELENEFSNDDGYDDV